MQYFIACMPRYLQSLVVHVCDQLIMIIMVLAEAAGFGLDRPVIPTLAAAGFAVR